MHYIAAGIVFGWMVGFVGAVVVIGAAMLVLKGICKLYQFIRSATRKTDAAKDERPEINQE